MTKRYTRLTLAEREEISKGLWAGENFVNIADRLGRNTSTVSREVKRMVKKKRRSYQALGAHVASKVRRCTQKKPKKLDTNSRLREYVYAKLKHEWSPDEIAERIKKAYPTDMTMRISHEAIYQYLYCLPRGELRRELMKGLRQERKQRLPRANTGYKRRSKITDLISISERPEETKDRTIPGHWEGDLIVGKGNKSALGTLVERTTRLTLLVPLHAKDAYSVRTAFAKAFKHIPEKFKKTLTYDRGTEMSEHRLFTKTTKIQVYFADPHAPWQRGTNENTNGLIRQYFPKGTDFNTVTQAQIKEAEKRLNSRPRKTLGYFTPSESFYSLTTGKKIAVEG